MMKQSLVMAAVLAEKVSAGVSRQPVVYEISTRPWLYSMAQKGIAASCGDYVCLRDIPTGEWQQMANDHIDIIWLMGVWQLGDYGLQHDRSTAKMGEFRSYLPDVVEADVIGSPYAVVEYKVHSDIGTDQDLVDLRSTLNSFGLKLMLDFVPNHMAVDNAILASDPDVFLEKPVATSSPESWWITQSGRTFAHGRGPYDGPWTDTIQVNYWSSAGIQAMTDNLVYVASKCDAVRVDMAHLILNDVWENAWGDDMSAGGFSRPSHEFWQLAIDAVRAHHPDTLFMAEAYNYYITSPPEKDMLQNLGFDTVYDKTVLDLLEGSNLDDLRGYVSSQSQGFFERTAHFVENHDEPRAAAALHGKQQAFAGALVSWTLPGLRLAFFGQLDGFSRKLGVQVRRAVAETPDAALHLQYTRLLTILKDDVFHTGTWQYIDVPKDGTGWRLAAWRWSSSDTKTKRLVVVNFSDTMAWANVQVADAYGFNGSDGLWITELFSSNRYQRSAVEMRSNGLVCGVGGFSAQIFDYSEQFEHIAVV